MDTMQIVAIELSGGNGHEHIVRLGWVDPAGSGQQVSTKAQIVAWIEKGGYAFTSEGHGRVTVGVITPAHGAKYLRTHANGQWTDNLLALPRLQTTR